MVRLTAILLLALSSTAFAAAEPAGSLRVFICGSSSPLADLKRAQACIAVVTDDAYVLFDTGSGSGTRLSLGGLPAARLSGVFLTHFHSDHISDLYAINLTSWASGRRQPLQVFGPAGVERVVAGLNEAYALDRGYRVAHHGAQLLKPAAGVLQARLIEPGAVQRVGGLKITAIAVDHAPIRPAFGYRIDYGDRSVVISGDTVVSEALMEAARGTDLLLHDALSPAILQAAVANAENAGLTVRAQILRDVIGYHAHTTAVVQAARKAGVRQLAFYHLVPPPRNAHMQEVFMRGVGDDVILTEDLMWFELPLGSDRIDVTGPPSE